MLFVGTDIVEIARIRNAARRHSGFWEKVLSPQERKLCLEKKDPIPSLAGRFAAKEAVLKCLGTGLRGISWQDMEILPDDRGCPQVYFTEKMKKILRTHGLQTIKVSVSHSRDYATAVAVGEGWPNENRNRE